MRGRRDEDEGIYKRVSAVDIQGKLLSAVGWENVERIRKGMG